MTKVGTAQASERIEFQAGGMVLLFAGFTTGPLSCPTTPLDPNRCAKAAPRTNAIRAASSLGPRAADPRVTLARVRGWLKEAPAARS